MQTRTKVAKTKLAAVKTASRPEVTRTPVTPKVLDPLSPAEAQTAQPTVSLIDRERAEKEQKYERARAELLQTIPELSGLYCSHLSYFLQLLKADRGCSTPMENFITSLVWRWAETPESPWLALNPDVIVTDLIEGPDGLRINFDDAMEAARLFNRQYLPFVGKKDYLGTAQTAIRDLENNESLMDHYSRDPQQIARHLQIAREFYAAAPELVVPPSAEFDSQLEEIAQ
jgi:hypothetical protein